MSLQFYTRYARSGKKDLIVGYAFSDKSAIWKTFEMSHDDRGGFYGTYDYFMNVGDIGNPIFEIQKGFDDPFGAILGINATVLLDMQFYTPEQQTEYVAFPFLFYTQNKKIEMRVHQNALSGTASYGIPEFTFVDLDNDNQKELLFDYYNGFWKNNRKESHQGGYWKMTPDICPTTNDTCAQWCLKHNIFMPANGNDFEDDNKRGPQGCIRSASNICQWNLKKDSPYTISSVANGMMCVGGFNWQHVTNEFIYSVEFDTGSVQLAPAASGGFAVGDFAGGDGASYPEMIRPGSLLYDTIPAANPDHRHVRAANPDHYLLQFYELGSSSCDVANQCNNRGTCIPDLARGIGATQCSCKGNYDGTQCQSCGIGTTEDVRSQQEASIGFSKPPVCTECVAGQYRTSVGFKLKRDEFTLTYGGHNPGDVCPRRGVLIGSSCKILETRGFVSESMCLDCTQGLFNNRTGMTTCFSCPKGYYSSTNASSFCLPCQPGRFSSKEASSKCAECAAEKYQPNPTSDICMSCPNGKVSSTLFTSCIQPSYKTAGDCNPVDEYLQENKQNPHENSCVRCPKGASCSGPITWEGVRPLFGWARCLNDSSKFDKCPYPASCWGGKNAAFRDGQYPSNLDRKNGSCGKQKNSANVSAYVPLSRLCFRCNEGFSHSEALDSKCDECPAKENNLFLIFAAIIGMCIGLVIYIQITLSDGGSLDESDGAKSIGLSYLQLLVLTRTFPIAWPQIFMTLFNISGSVTELGQHIINIKCLFPTMTEADVFFARAIAWACAPVALLLSATLTWVCVAAIIRCACTKCLSKVTELKIKIHVSNVGLLYLLWPSLCSQTFSLFACRSVCGDNSLYLRADLDETCWQGRHLTFILSVGLPMILLYIIGLPLASVLRLKLMERRADEMAQLVNVAAAVDENKYHPNNLDNQISHIALHLPVEHKIYGLFYSAYRKETWWWEGTVAARKIVIAMIGVFGARMGVVQVSLALFLVVFIFGVTSHVRPYGGRTRNMLHGMEMLSLFAAFATLWAGSVFNSYPSCQNTEMETENCNNLQTVTLCTKASASNCAWKEGKCVSLGLPTLVWCDLVSWIIVLINVFVVLIIAIGFVYIKRVEGKPAEQTYSEDNIMHENPYSNVNGNQGIELTNIGTPAVAIVTPTDFIVEMVDKLKTMYKQVNSEKLKENPNIVNDLIKHFLTLSEGDENKARVQLVKTARHTYKYDLENEQLLKTKGTDGRGNENENEKTAGQLKDSKVKKKKKKVGKTTKAEEVKEEEWSSTIDSTTGKEYYFNTKNQRTTWTKPPELGATHIETETNRK
jgi:hypothetical protein